MWQAAACSACALVALIRVDEIGASEFRGGSATGPIFFMFNIGILLFVAALIVTFFYPRVGATISVSASLSCLPLYFCWLAPGPFRWVFRGEYDAPLTASFVWDNWAGAGALTLALAVAICISNLWSLSGKRRGQS